jgi:hypothetical protein
VAAAAGLQPLPHHPHLQQQQQHQQQGSHGAGPSSSSSSSRLPSWAARVVCEQRDVVPWVMRRLEGGSTSGEAADTSLSLGVDGRQWHACLLHPRHRVLLHADVLHFAGSMHAWAGISGHDHAGHASVRYKCCVVRASMHRALIATSASCPHLRGGSICQALPGT